MAIASLGISWGNRPNVRISCHILPQEYDQDSLMAALEIREGDNDETLIVVEKVVVEEDLDLDDLHDTERA